MIHTSVSWWLEQVQARMLSYNHFLKMVSRYYSIHYNYYYIIWTIWYLSWLISVVVQTYMPSNPEWNLLKTEIIEPNQLEFIPTAEKGTQISKIKEHWLHMNHIIWAILYDLYLIGDSLTNRVKCPIQIWSRLKQEDMLMFKAWSLSLFMNDPLYSQNKFSLFQSFWYSLVSY